MMPLQRLRIACVFQTLLMAMRTIAKSQRLRLANATVQPEGPSDPNIRDAIHFRNGASRVALDKIEWTSPRQPQDGERAY
jgi:hypothetical protein